MGEAPVLVDGDVRLTQSGVIQDYLSEKTGFFGGDTPRTRARFFAGCLWDNHKLSSVAGHGAVPLAFHSAGETPRRSDRVPARAALTGGACKVLEAHLTSRDWIAGRSVTNADLTCCGYLFYDEPFGFTRTDWPAIDAWLGRIEGLDGWKHPYDLMPRAWPGA